MKNHNLNLYGKYFTQYKYLGMSLIITLSDQIEDIKAKELNIIHLTKEKE